MSLGALLPPTRMTTEELLVRLRDALARHRLGGRDLDFAKSVIWQSRRRGWRPSKKQRTVMERIVRDLRGTAAPNFDGELDLLDRGDA